MQKLWRQLDQAAISYVSLAIKRKRAARLRHADAVAKLDAQLRAAKETRRAARQAMKAHEMSHAVLMTLWEATRRIH
jgi:hypothetical protein